MFGRRVMVKSQKAWLSALVVLILSMSYPGVSAQEQGADVAIASFQVPDPLVGGHDQDLDVIVRNEGAAPASVEVSMHYQDGGVTTEFYRSSMTVVPAGSTETFSTVWDALESCGSTSCDYEDLWINGGDSATTLTAEVTMVGAEDSDPSDNRATTSRFIHYHLLSLHVQDRDPFGETTLAPGADWATTVYITNEGNAWDTADLSLQSPTEGWTFDLERESVGVSAGGEAAVVLRAKAPTDAERGEEGEVYVLVDSENVDLPSDPGRRNKTVSTPEVGLRGAITATVEMEDPEVLPGETTDLLIDVTNGYNEDVHIEPGLDLISFPSGACNGGPCPTISVDPDEELVGPYNTTSFTVSITVPEDPRHPDPEMARAGEYTWAVDLDLDTPHEDLEAKDLGVVSLQVLPVRDLEIEAVSSTGDVDLVPGPEPDAGQNVVHAKVWNLGNIQETVLLNTTAMPEGWTVSQDWEERTADMEDLILEPGAFQHVNWTIETPPGDPPGEYTIDIRVESQDDPLAQSDPIAFTADLLELPRLGFSGETTIGVAADGSVSQPMTIRNIGNEEASVSLHIENRTAQPTSDLSKWTTGLGDSSFVLQPGASKSVPLTISAPSGLSVEDGLSFDLHMDVVGHPAQSIQTHIEAFLPSPDLAVTIEESDSLYAEAEPTVHVTVSNEGTAALERSVQVVLTVSNETDSKISSTVHSFSSLAEKGVREFQVALPAVAGTFVVEAVVDPQDDIEEHDEQNNEAGAEFDVKDLGIKITPPLNRTAVPGQTLSFEGARGFLVTNTGLDRMDIEYRLYDLQGWMEPIEGELSLDAEESRSIDALFRVPSHLQSQSSALHIEANPDGVPVALNSSAVWVFVEDDVPPRITEVTATPNVVRAGEVVRFSAKATDALGVQFVTGYLQVPGAEKSAAQQMMWDPVRQVWATEIRMTAVGDHSWYVWAKDNSTDGNEAVTSDSPLTVRVLPSTNETLQVLQDRPVRPGVPFEVTLFATAPVEDLTYQIDDGPVRDLSLTNPLQVPTAGLEDGSYEVHIRVNDTQGNRLDETFLFTVDGTPPAIAEFYLSPNGTAGAEGVKLHVRFKDPQEIVSAVVRPLDGSQAGSKDVPLELRGGVHSAMLAIGPSDGLVVLAEDAAGNRLYRNMGADEVDAATLHAGGSNGIPLLGPIPVLLGLVLVACMVARSRREGRL